MSERPRAVVGAALVLAALGALGGSGAAQTSRRAPTFDSLFRELASDEHHDLNGVLVVQRGAVVAERYFNGEGPETLHDIRSATKSITSTLVGIAIDRHLIRGVDDRLPALLRGAGSDKQAIRLEDLLTMRSGLAADDDDPASPGNETLMDRSPSWRTFALSVPLVTEPGSRYLYCSLNAFLAGAVVESAAGQPLDAFAKGSLFGPLGITSFAWRHGPDGPVAGQGNLRLRLRDMAAFGSMILAGGESGGTRIVSRAWLAEALAPRVSIAAVDPFADAYGYMWYTKTYELEGRPVTVHFASGNGGNKIYVVPSDAAVIAITSSAYNTRYGQRRSERILLDLLALIRS